MLDEVLATVSGDVAEGVRLVQSILSRPLWRIATNAGGDPDAIIAEVTRVNSGYGYNAAIGKYQNMIEAGIIDPVKNYTLDSYLNDLIAEVFKTTYQGRKLNNIERDLQSETINQFIRYSSLKPASSGIRNLDFTDDIDLESEAFPCSHALCRHHDSEEQSFTRINMGPALSSADMAPYMTGALKKVLALYKQKRAATADSATRNFYDYQIITIEKLFNN